MIIALIHAIRLNRQESGKSVGLVVCYYVRKIKHGIPFIVFIVAVKRAIWLIIEFVGITPIARLFAIHFVELIPFEIAVIISKTYYFHRNTGRSCGFGYRIF